MAEPAEVSLRDATLADAEPVRELSRSLGMLVPEERGAMDEIWKRLWTRNPAATSGDMAGLAGWVLEADGRVVGFFGSIPRRYRFGARTLRVATANNWAVLRPFRTHTNELAKKFFGQVGFDMWMSNTTIQAAERIFARFGARPMPQRDYLRVHYWVLDAGGFLRAALRKLDLRDSVVAAGGGALAPFLAAGLAVRGRPRRIRGVDPEAIPLSAVGDDFDDLWLRRLGEGGKILYASRTAEDLRWHFEGADRRGELTVLCCRGGGRLKGYLVLVRDRPPRLGLHRARVADLFVEGNDGAVADALLAAAYEAAKEHGCHVLELVGLPRELRARAARWRPLTRTFPTSPFHYRPAEEALGADLARPEAWYPTFYDGDSSLL